MDRLDGMRIFVRVAELGSFSAVAQQLGVARSVVTRKVAALEAGILMYETKTGGEVFVAIDEGILVKAGRDVLVSVRQALGGTDLEHQVGPLTGWCDRILI
mgnify:CR=1 FL=1